jgi:hypothetical protein
MRIGFLKKAFQTLQISQKLFSVIGHSNIPFTDACYINNIILSHIDKSSLGARRL